MRTFLPTVLCLFTACADPAPSMEEIAAEAIAAQVGTPPDRAEFHDELVGVWRTVEPIQGLWVDLIWFVGRHYAWHDVTIYADQALQVPLVRWDIVRAYALDQRSAAFPEAFEMTWTDVGSWLTAYVDDPALFAQIGIDDCGLAAGVTVDLSPSNCGAPLFPFRDCDMMDFVELSGGRLTFGDPTEGDRCVQRPTRYEEWSFERVVWPW